jgi:hypothetical protein
MIAGGGIQGESLDCGQRLGGWICYVSKQQVFER